MNKNRLEALSDGIFAVAITLLALDIRIPSGVEYDHLGQAILALAPKIVSYLFSFCVIGVYWTIHHFAFSRVRKIDGTLLFLNMLILLVVTFMPFPTILIGEYPFTPLPLVIYGGCLLSANLIGFLTVVHLHRHPELLDLRHRNAFLRTQVPLYVAVNIPYIVATALAFYSPLTSYVIYIVVLATVGLTFWRRMNSVTLGGGASD
jgi:uncharacterized membrane protein